MTDKRVTFASKIGVVAAAAGSAVGLGNIWRFPSQAADGGGAIFIFIYIACILFFGLPVMMSEFIIGRSARANSAGVFHKLAPGTPWKWVGRMGVLAGFMIMGFYMVVCGWTLVYVFQSISGNLATVNDFTVQFNNLLANPLKQSFWMVVFTLLTSYFIFSGVRKGIENSSKILMPMLFLMLIILAVRALLLPGAGAGIDFLFKPNFDNVKSTVFLDAMGQAFFSLSVGMGCLITYGSYFNKDIILTKTALLVSILDTLVALIAGLVIFPAAFALTANPDTIVDELVTGGPGLLFITIPELFIQMPGSMIWSTLFFCLLSLAALTSTISLMEVVTIYISEEYKISRKSSVLLVTVGVIILGIISSYSNSFFNILDIVSAKYMLPAGGLFISLFVGWYLNRNVVESELTNDGKLKFGVAFLKVYIFLLRYIAPIAILSIFIYGIVG
jgi:NSS family neurotransmitter:Na+ symporter